MIFSFLHCYSRLQDVKRHTPYDIGIHDMCDGCFLLAVRVTLATGVMCEIFAKREMKNNYAAADDQREASPPGAVRG